MLVRILLAATSMMLASPVSSFETYNLVPSLLSAICSGSDPLVRTRRTFRVAMSTMPMPSALRFGRRQLALVDSGRRDRRSAQGDEQLRAVRAHLDTAWTLSQRDGRHHLIRAAVDHRQIAADFVGDIHVIRRLGRLWGRGGGRSRRLLLRLGWSPTCRHGRQDDEPENTESHVGCYI
jgi:hypothetical protein